MKTYAKKLWHHRTGETVRFRQWEGRVGGLLVEVNGRAVWTRDKSALAHCHRELDINPALFGRE